MDERDKDPYETNSLIYYCHCKLYWYLNVILLLSERSYLQDIGAAKILHSLLLATINTYSLYSE